MFIYDGIRSQLEWNSTLSPAKAILPTAETKFLRKVCHHPLSRTNSRPTHPLDRHHCDDWYGFTLGDSIETLMSLQGQTQTLSKSLLH